jgi:hypothetical protein
MAKNKISEFSSTPANNTDIGGIDIAEGCAPSGINNAIRELMAQLKDQQAGTDADNFTVGGNLVVTGTTTATALTTTGNTILGDASSDTLNVGNGGLIKNASGNLGLGVNPSAWGSGFVGQQIGNSLSLWGTPTSSSNAGMMANSYINSSLDNIYIATGYATLYQQYQGGHYWYTAPAGTAGATVSFTQPMTLDASGQLLVGTTSTFLAGTHSFQNYGGQEGVLTLRNSSATGTTWRVGPNSAGSMVVYNQNSVGVYMATGGTAWLANSDERLKTDLKPIENAAEKVSTLRAVTGRYTKDEQGVSRAFLIAQDVQAVLPEAVNIQDDELSTLGVAYTDVIPLLVAAIKELTARLDVLENK